MLVALAIGTLLIAASTQLFVAGQRAYRSGERIAELQETARHSLSLLEFDLRMAGFLGRAGAGAPVAQSATPEEPMPRALAMAAGAIDACGPRWAINVAVPVAVHDEHYDLDCAPFNRRSQPASDVLVIRRAGTPVSTPPDTPRLRIAATAGRAVLFIASCGDRRQPSCSRVPPPPDLPGGDLHDLLAHAWYVSRDATGRPGLPALRRKRLTGGAAGASLQDEEIIAGIETLQVQVGIAGPAGSPVRFMEPESVDFSDPSQPVVALRLWLLVRADSAEPGFVDAVTREFPPGRVWPARRDGIRRLLVSGTIHLRNSGS